MAGGPERRTARRRALRWLGGPLALALAAACANEPAPADSPLPPAAPEQAEGAPFGGYLAGRFAHARRDYAAAASHLSRALARDPDNPDLLRRTLSLQVADGRTEEAVALARRLVAARADARLAHLLLGLDAARAGDFAGALERVAGMRRDGAYAFLLPLVEGWLQLGAGAPEAALAALAPLGAREPYRPFFAFHAGLVNALAGRPAQAEALLREAVAASDGALRPVAALGRFLARTGRGADARAVYEDYLARNPDSDWAARASAGREAEAGPLVADAGEGLAEALLGAAGARPHRGADAGLIYARLALFLRDDLDEARVLIGEILEEADRPEDAGAVYRAVPRDSPFAWPARLREAASLADSGRVDAAADALRTMAEERPERADAARLLGDVLRMNERYAEAVPAYDAAVARTAPVAERHWHLFYARGVALERVKEWPRAEADFLRALELWPEQPLVLNYLGYSWVEQRRNLDRAKAMIEKAVELRPGDGYIVDSLGWVAYRLGDYEEAVRQLERAVELHAGDPVINDHLGDAYWRVGRRNEARFQWRRALVLELDADLVEGIRRKLAEGLAADEAAPPSAR